MTWIPSFVGDFPSQACVCFTTLVTICYVLACPDVLVMEESPFTREDFLGGRCVHKKEWSGQIYEEIRAKSALCFNKATLPEVNLCKFEKKTSLTGAVLDVKWSGNSQKYGDVSAHLDKLLLQSPRKSMMKLSAVSQIPNTCNFFKRTWILCSAFVNILRLSAEMSCMLSVKITLPWATRVLKVWRKGSRACCYISMSLQLN